MLGPVCLLECQAEDAKKIGWIEGKDFILRQPMKKVEVEQPGSSSGS